MFSYLSQHEVLSMDPPTRSYDLLLEFLQMHSIRIALFFFFSTHISANSLFRVTVKNIRGQSAAGNVLHRQLNFGSRIFTDFEQHNHT